MKVKVLKEAGVGGALLGLSLSYNSNPSLKVANNLAFKQGGHNKFLESIQVWLDLEAPRYFWQQFDTYRCGMTKQSESTMHTILRTPLEQSHFERGCSKSILKKLNKWRIKKKFKKLKRHLPESFLQRRIVSTNYRVLQSMELQRRSHKLPEWQLFLNVLQDELVNPEWVKEVV